MESSEFQEKSHMNQAIVLVGIAVIFLGFLLVLAGILSGGKKSSVHVGFGGFIGPVPIGFATDRGTLYVVIAASILMLLYMLFFLRS
jgi:uncharacterized membrane protein